MKNLLVIILGFIIFSCTRNSSTEKYQTDRNNVENVHDCIKEFETDSILIGNNARIYIMDNYLLIADHRGYDKQIHVFDKNTFRHLASTAPLGQGPTEITVLGAIAADEKRGKFYVSDHGKNKIFSYDMDSVLADPDYTPSVKLVMDKTNFPSEYEYINDTLCIARTILPKGVNDYMPSISRWNMQTGKMLSISYNHPNIKKKRITCASSQQYGLIAELYNNYDLLTISDFNGKLRCNIYGPAWGSTQRNHYYGDGFFDNSNHLIASFSGGDNNTDAYYPTCLLVFGLDGEYIKTLDVGYKINSMRYDNKTNRLYMNLNDEIQFAYLNLDGLIK